MSSQNFLEIDLGRLGQNFRNIKKFIGPETGIIAVVKANAYGHGLREVGKRFSEEGADFLAVADFEEAMILRGEILHTPILILSWVPKENIESAIFNDLRMTVYDFQSARSINREAAKLGLKAKVHLKIDTGMHRLGIDATDEKNMEQIKDFFEALMKLPNLEIEGIFSHFADVSDRRYSQKQLDVFASVLLLAQQIFGERLPKIHMASSAATKLLPQSYFDLVRPGLALYGVAPEWPENKMVMKFYAQVMQIKNLEKGETLGYKRAYRAAKKMKIAVLGVGYSDGFDRGFSNCGYIYIKGQKCPVVGMVCMNQTIVDVSKIKEIKIGDKALLLGEGKDGIIRASDWAKMLGTNIHEVVSRIPEHVVRIYKS